jgi:hypothetical protein
MGSKIGKRQRRNDIPCKLVRSDIPSRELEKTKTRDDHYRRGYLNAVAYAEGWRDGIECTLGDRGHALD